MSYIRTEEHRRKMSKILMSPEINQKLGKHARGKTLEEQGHKPDCPCCYCRTKRGERKGKNHPSYGKHKLFTEGHKQNIAKALIGHRHSEKTKQKIRNSLIDWDFYNKYGTTRGQYPYPPEFNNKLRKQICERDLYICQLCDEILPEYWAIHHIDYNKDNNNPINQT